MKKFLVLLLLSSFVGLFANVVKQQIKLDRSVLLKEKQTLYLLVTFEVEEVKSDKRVPINLSLVLDRSGSMADKGKLKYAKDAAKFVVKNLSSIDTLSIIEYDDKVTTLWPSSPVVSKKLIEDMIDNLYPRGSTNLTGGMMKGAREVLKKYNSKQINRVILLSDGLANTGVTDVEEINEIVRDYKKQGVTISTMGLGLSYNEDLMQNIAENAGGKYYYIESPTQMNFIFSEEMNTIFKTVAKNIVFVYKGSEAVEGVEVFGYKSEIDKNSANVKLEDFYSSEKRTLLFKLNINPKKEGKIDLGKISFKYLNNLKNKDENVETQITANVSTSIKEVNASINKDVQAEAIMVEAEIEHKAYVKMYEEGRKDEAKKNIIKLSNKIEIANKSINNVQLEKKVEALNMEKTEMENADKSFSNKSNYLKMSKQRFFYNIKGKRGKSVQQVGDTGYDVKRLQKALKDKNLYKGDVDGVYSKELESSVKEFQKQSKIKDDGVAGPKTLKELNLY